MNTTEEIKFRLTGPEKDILLRVIGRSPGSLGIKVRGDFVVWNNRDSITAFLDYFQLTLDNWRTRMRAQGKDSDTDVMLRRGSRLIVKISKDIQRLPSSLFVTGVILHDRNPISGGGYADIWRARHRGKRVALKRLRVFTMDAHYDRMIADFTREALMWRQLEHKHLLPFLGVDMNTFQGVPCMVSPWMPGNVLKYLAYKRASIQLLKRLLLEILDGLVYLHARSILHGDLRSANILIDNGEHVRLGDFGLSRIASETATLHTSFSRGAIRWMAPEQLSPAEIIDTISLSQMSTDVYSFGCVVLELFTLRVPFYYIPNDMMVMFHVTKGEHPAHPPPSDCAVDIPPTVWFLLQHCWNQDPKRRFTAAGLMAHMSKPWIQRDDRHSPLATSARAHVPAQSNTATTASRMPYTSAYVPSPLLVHTNVPLESPQLAGRSRTYVPYSVTVAGYHTAPATDSTPNSQPDDYSILSDSSTSDDESTSEDDSTSEDEGVLNDGDASDEDLSFTPWVPSVPSVPPSTAALAPGLGTTQQSTVPPPPAQAAPAQSPVVSAAKVPVVARSAADNGLRYSLYRADNDVAEQQNARIPAAFARWMPSGLPPMPAPRTAPGSTTQPPMLVPAPAMDRRAMSSRRAPVIARSASDDSLRYNARDEKDDRVSPYRANMPGPSSSMLPPRVAVRKTVPSSPPMPAPRRVVRAQRAPVPVRSASDDSLRYSSYIGEQEGAGRASPNSTLLERRAPSGRPYSPAPPQRPSPAPKVRTASRGFPAEPVPIPPARPMRTSVRPFLDAPVTTTRSRSDEEARSGSYGREARAGSRPAPVGGWLFERWVPGSPITMMHAHDEEHGSS